MAAGCAARCRGPVTGRPTTRKPKVRTVSDESDGRDPLRAAFQDHQRAPRDIVPHSQRDVEDLRALAGTTVTVRHYELASTGVREYTEQIEVCSPITQEENR